ncbi:MAG TPA: aldehyde ferredoxin oxidoreductase, partial [Nitrospirae bacterium]|nr:aldehyde ferredoxin oxidoreductase [Nitrospirota bacterium]
TLNGFSRKDDDLPERFFRDAGYSDENVTIPPIRRKDFDDALDRYYRIRGYDEDGRVTEEDKRAGK